MIEDILFLYDGYRSAINVDIFLFYPYKITSYICYMENVL